MKTVITAAALAFAAVSASADGYSAPVEPIVIQPVETGSMGGALVPILIGAALIALAVSQND